MKRGFGPLGDLKWHSFWAELIDRYKSSTEPNSDCFPTVRGEQNEHCLHFIVWKELPGAVRKGRITYHWADLGTIVLSGRGCITQRRRLKMKFPSMAEIL